MAEQTQRLISDEERELFRDILDSCEYAKEDGMEDENLDKLMEEVKKQIPDINIIIALYNTFYESKDKVQKKYMPYAGYLACVGISIRDIKRKQRPPIGYQKEGLHSGMIVKTAAGHYYMVFRGTGMEKSLISDNDVLMMTDCDGNLTHTGWLRLSDYDENLMFKDRKQNEYDIEEVLCAKCSNYIGLLKEYKTVWKWKE